MQTCQRGDLLLVLADKITRAWKQIIYFGGRTPDRRQSQLEAPSEQLAAVEAPEQAPVEQPYQPTPGYAVLRDERGVRIASEEAD
jgi:cyanophycin synthetase